MPMIQLEKFVEVRRITKTRGPFVMETEYIEHRWVDEHSHPPDGHLYCPPSTGWMELNNSPQTIRVKRS